MYTFFLIFVCYLPCSSSLGFTAISPLPLLSQKMLIPRRQELKPVFHHSLMTVAHERAGHSHAFNRRIELLSTRWIKTRCTPFWRLSSAIEHALSAPKPRCLLHPLPIPDYKADKYGDSRNQDSEPVSAHKSRIAKYRYG